MCVCPLSCVDLADDESGGEEVVVDEMYENQRYSPVLGWGSTWPGHLLPTDPSRYSTPDLARSSMVCSTPPAVCPRLMA